MYFTYIENELNTYYNQIKHSKVKDIIKYSLEDGKCIRGFIVKHIMEINNCHYWEPIVAIELIHGISLIIDDLPCMDNDRERRNKPSTFVKFGERQSILISMYGIGEAFNLLFKSLKQTNNYNTLYIEKLFDEWQENIGQNLIIGQMLDLKEDISKLLNIDIINDNLNLMVYKTGALFSFAFILGAIYSNIENIDDYKKMGYYFGIMFQIMDDFKDIDTDEKSANYVLMNGVSNSIQLYLECKIKLLELFEKCNIYTDKIEELIHLIDRYIPYNNGHSE